MMLPMTGHRMILLLVQLSLLNLLLFLSLHRNPCLAPRNRYQPEVLPMQLSLRTGLRLAQLWISRP